MPDSVDRLLPFLAIESKMPRLVPSGRMIVRGDFMSAREPLVMSPIAVAPHPASTRQAQHDRAEHAHLHLAPLHPRIREFAAVSMGPG